MFGTPAALVTAGHVTKIGYALVATAALWAALPAVAGNMGVDEARAFVVGNLFSFTCFEGTSGEGRVYADGSVGGLIRLGGAGSPQYATLPPGTLRIRGDAVCAQISGMPFEVCFDLDRTGPKSFRGSVAAMSPLASCQFSKQANQAGMASTSSPLSIQPTVARPNRR
jgi:hypothetical protein